jgi:hypothetical protein
MSCSRVVITVLSLSLLALPISGCEDRSGEDPGGTGGTGGQIIEDPLLETECDNGILEEGEECDSAIQGGPGTCPEACNDNNACTTDELVGAECQRRCEYTAIAGCTNGCGNGAVEVGETCDTAIAAGQAGACPASCDDGNSCTTESVAGTDCNQLCEYSPVTTCSGDTQDGCCAADCNANNDSDCSPTCGNGAVEVGETCDTAIDAAAPGACPADCDDKNSCTNDQLTGSACGASCTHNPVTACGAQADGCCPAGCNANNDGDCSPSCGNGVTESGETCDTAIAAGLPGACPTTCDDGNACTIDIFVGGTCGLSCSNSGLTTCNIVSDGCCPIGCDANTDADCSPACGNGVVEESEVCDTAITGDVEGACITSCDDGDACTLDQFVGGDCDLTCSNTKVTACNLKSDGCCPTGCDGANDPDCPSVCLNAVLELGEECDKPEFGGKTCKDYGYTAGYLICHQCKILSSKCGTCGNGVIDGNEECDGADLGGAECSRYSEGSLQCSSSCTLDYSQCYQYLVVDQIRFKRAEQSDGS